MAILIFVLIFVFIIIALAYAVGKDNINNTTNVKPKVKTGGYRMGKNGCWYPYGSAWHYQRRK